MTKNENLLLQGALTCGLPFTLTSPSLMEACSRARLACGSLAAR